MKLQRVLLGLVALWINGISGYIYEVNVVRRWDNQQKRYQYVIGLSDFHDKAHSANKQQRDFLGTLFKKSSHLNPQVIVEDVSSPGAQGRRYCGRFFVDAHLGILSGISDECKQCGVKDVDNVEYRYCRVTSLGPLVHARHQDMARIPSTSSIKIEALLEEITTMIAEVRAYDDGAVLTKHYQETLSAIEQELKQLKFYDCQHMSVGDYVVHNERGNRFELVKRLLTFDSSLLDLKMLHHIYASHDKTTILNIAGGAHVSRVTDILKKIGYEEVHSHQVTMVRENDLQKCVGCPLINEQYCLKPEPVDISIVNEYM